VEPQIRGLTCGFVVPVDADPLTWLLEVDGMLVDIRQAPVQLQVQAFQLGLIPYIPGTADDRS